MRMRKGGGASPSSQAQSFGWSTRAENVMMVRIGLMAPRRRNRLTQLL